ncbi:MAG: T9SS type A sorting domain-containing protein [Bacteroidia bacterium]|nr:T9SS type A sorting domain-containing protein [Bacteroidia bacterium]
MKNKTLSILLLAAITLPSPSVHGQNARISVGEMKRMHNETLDDPYLPNADNNKRTSPAYRYTSRVKSNPMRSSIFTIQVNVNANGQNILGDAANEPSIAVNPVNPNEMVIGWRQFDNVSSNFRQAGWGYSTDGGKSWTFPGVIEPGIFRSDPVLDYDTEGNFYYNSLTNSPDYFCKVFESTNGGAAWNSGTDAHGGDKQWMVIDRSAETSRGNIYSFWSNFYSTCSPGFATRSTDGGDHYENCFLVDGYPYWGTMAVGNSGELYIGGASGITDSLVVAKSLNAREGESMVIWNKPVLVYIDGNPNGWQGVNPGGLLGQVNIDVDRSNGPGRGNVYLLAPVTRSSNADPCDVMFAGSSDGGLTWSSPIRVNDDPLATNTQWFGTMSVAPDGRIDAIWLDTRDAPPGSDSSALYYSFSCDQGKTWSVNEKMSGSFDPHTGYPDQNKMGDYFDMVSDSSGAHVAWAGTFNGEQDVFYSHIVPYTSTGVNEISGNTRIKIYPNPVTGTLVIRGLATDSRVEIYTFLGVKLHSVNSRNTTCEIDISAQPAGIYLLKIVDQNGSTVVKKIVKN